MEKHRQYLEYINEKIISYASFDFARTVEFKANSDVDEMLLKLATNVNLLGEELKAKVDELQRVNKELNKQKNFILSVMEVIPSHIFVVDNETMEVSFANRCANDQKNLPCFSCMMDSSVSGKTCLCGKRSKNSPLVESYEKNGHREIKILEEGAVPKWFSLQRSEFKKNVQNYGINSTIFSLSDITDLKQKEINLLKKEEIISDSLREKGMLLQEVHHRVKNNLQIIYGLLSMQANGTENNEVKAHLSEIQNRIFSISLIHEELYQSENFLTIDLANYCKKLCNTLSAVSYSDKKVAIVYELAEDVKINIERATPLGLFVNEVICNAYKHAFNFTDQGKIIVQLNKSAEEIILTIKDNGPGFTGGNEKFFSSSSLGGKLIKGLAQQLKAKLQVDGSNGCSVSIEIPINTKSKQKPKVHAEYS